MRLAAQGWAESREIALAGTSVDSREHVVQQVRVVAANQKGTTGKERDAGVPVAAPLALGMVRQPCEHQEQHEQADARGQIPEQKRLPEKPRQAEPDQRQQRDPLLASKEADFVTRLEDPAHGSGQKALAAR